MDQSNLILESKTELTSLFLSGETSLKEIEKQVILTTLKNRGFNRTHTARTLGIGIRTLQRKLKQYQAGEKPAHGLS